MNKTIAGAILMTATSLAAHAAAPDRPFGDEGPTLVPNAFGLVYEGALSENKPGAVNLRRVEYAVEGIRVAANVYLPADYDPAGRRAAVVVAHPNGGSKDQVAGLYAQRLAEAGFVALAFDARYQGESGGEPRRTDKPAHRIGDILGAVDFIQNFPGVAPERVGAFGICGGGGYTFAAAQVDKRIKAVATLSLFNTGDVRRNGYMRTQTATRAERQREAALARRREAAGAEPEVLGFADMTPDEARKLPVDLYREGFFYYGVTHKTPTAPGTYLKSSLMDMMAWDATDHADLIDQPLLVVAGDRADSLYMSEEAFAKATGTADKELFLVPGATHIKTYYVPEYTAAIAAKLRGFFSSRLAAPAAEPADPAPAAPAAEPLAIARQGVFSSGGRVTDPLPGDYDPTMNWLDPERRGTTAHVDHANTLFQIPADAAGAPVVFLHGYGQTRTGWQSTPDGRPGWADFFLRAGHPVFLVDQPRRGAAGATERVVTDPGDVADGRFKAGEQAWYTHFRIGRVAPDRYAGSQFPEGPEALEQFFCQMTPSTGNYDEALFGTALGAVLADARRMTGRKAVYVTHSQGGRVGWATPAEDVAAIVAVEPGFAPEVGSERYKKFLDAEVPMLFLFGDNIENGPEDIQSTAFWRAVLAQCRDFAEHYNADGGDATVLHLPDLGIRGNSHFLFQERNSDALAALVENWLRDRGLATR